MDPPKVLLHPPDVALGGLVVRQRPDALARRPGRGRWCGGGWCGSGRRTGAGGRGGRGIAGAQAAKASTAAMAKAASPPIRGVCLVLRDPPVVASAPDLLSTVDLLPPALADRLLESGTNQLGRLAHIGETSAARGSE